MHLWLPIKHREPMPSVMQFPFMSISNISNLFSHAGNILRHMSRAYGHRSQLASLETVEARQQVARIGTFGAVALTLGILGLFLFALTIAAFVWPLENRVLILGLVTLFFILTGMAFAFLTWRRFQSWTPWSETRLQLGEDCACLSEILSEIGPSSQK